MDRKYRMKLYEASKSSTKFTLEESLFEEVNENKFYIDSDDDLEPFVDILGYKDSVELGKGCYSNKICGDEQTISNLRNLIDKGYGMFYEIKPCKECSVEEDVIAEVDPIVTPVVEIETNTEEEIPTPQENGVQNMLQFLIKDEWDAIEGYNNTIQTLKPFGVYDDLCAVLQDISNEELVHVGQLQKALEFINPVASKIAEGETEATEQLTEPVAVEEA